MEYWDNGDWAAGSLYADNEYALPHLTVAQLFNIAKLMILPLFKDTDLLPFRVNLKYLVLLKTINV